MNVAAELRDARRRSGLTQRELARRAGTSQPALSAYEAGRRDPGVATFTRLLAAAGAELRVGPTPGGRTPADLALAGERLAEVLALAQELPFRRPGPLRFPRLPSS